MIAMSVAETPSSGSGNAVQWNVGIKEEAYPATVGLGFMCSCPTRVWNLEN